MFFNIFTGHFGRGGGQQQRERRSRDTIHQMTVNLDQLYNGVTKRLKLSRDTVCDKCEGRGGKEGSVQNCAPCKGTGVQMRFHQLAPGMVQQTQSVCGECRGEGQIIPAKDRCKTCNGKKIVKIETVGLIGSASKDYCYRCSKCTLIKACAMAKRSPSRVRAIRNRVCSPATSLSFSRKLSIRCLRAKARICSCSSISNWSKRCAVARNG